MVRSWGPPEESGAAHSRTRDAAHMAWLLGRLGERWRKGPDQRFGQLVENVIRFNLPLDALRFMEDADFLALLDEQDRDHGR